MCVRARAVSRDLSSDLHDAIPCVVDAIPCVVPSLYILKQRRDFFWLVRACICFVCGVRFVCIARVCSCLAVGPSDRRVCGAFVRVSAWVFACMCMGFCMFESAFVMQSYVRSCACCVS